MTATITPTGPAYGDDRAANGAGSALRRRPIRRRSAAAWAGVRTCRTSATTPSNTTQSRRCSPTAGVLEAPAAPPAKVDLRKYFSPIEDQQTIGSCTANAGAGIIEYFQRRTFNKHVDGSRLFLYKATRACSDGRATPAPICARPWARCGRSACRPRTTGHRSRSL